MTGPLYPTTQHSSDQESDWFQMDDQHPEEGQQMANVESFEPGPSFVEDDRPAERLTDMPAWLQTFAAQETTRDEAAAEPGEPEQTTGEAHADVAAHNDESGDISLPDWLQDSGAADDDSPLVPEEQHAMHDFLTSFDDPGEHEASSFISEDDLPDWLRAFSDDSSPSAPSASMSRETSSPGSPVSVVRPSTAPVRVPPVENVWLSANERQALGPGGTLFALLASNANGALTHATASAGGGTTGEGTSGSGGGARGALSRSGSSSGPHGEGEAAAQANSMRLLLLTLLVVALVIAVSFWQFS